MRVEQLRYLDTVLRSGSLRRAADALLVSEPALSDQIRRTEEELGVRLLHRSRRGVAPTDACQALLGHMRAILQAEEGLRQTADSFKGLRAGTLRLGCCNAASRTLLPRVLFDFQQRCPAIDVQAVEIGSLDIEERVRRHEVELGLIGHPIDGCLDQDLDGELLLVGSLCVGVSRGHPLSRRRSLAGSDIARYPLVDVSRGHLVHHLMEGVVRGSNRRVAFTAEGTDSARRMVAAGVGISLLADFGIEGEGGADDGVVLCPPPASLRMKLGIFVVHASHVPLSPAATIFVEMLRSEATGLSACQPLVGRLPEFKRKRAQLAAGLDSAARFTRQGR